MLFDVEETESCAVNCSFECGTVKRLPAEWYYAVNDAGAPTFFGYKTPKTTPCCEKCRMEIMERYEKHGSKERRTQ